MEKDAATTETKETKVVEMKAEETSAASEELSRKEVAEAVLKVDKFKREQEKLCAEELDKVLKKHNCSIAISLNLQGNQIITHTGVKYNEKAF